MKILLIKTSSLGDVFHTLPALEDARRALPGLSVDWVVEEAFADIPAWHPVVDKVIPVAWRRWRKQPLAAHNRAEMRAFYQQMKSTRYDLVMDAQGLIKSALITRLACGRKVGLDRHSAREPLAARAYDQTLSVARGEHAIHRLRRLFAMALGYDETQYPFSYGVDRHRWQAPDIEASYWLFLHGTTWVTKLWPEDYWRQLATDVVASGRQVVLPWGNEEEHQRAMVIADGVEGVSVLPRMGLDSLTAYLAHAEAIVGVDTGLSHVAAALEIPAVAIYGATDASLTGALGPAMTVLKSDYSCAPCLSKRCLHPGSGDIQPPCYQQITPAAVMQAVLARM
ncbi:lipopolysaccharide heptosyltransferase I [Oceanobacter sp. 4_MG-2023]|uniref:lipopolysaccharide heptosyltransferase I n=1 Tax=Oceanobacter sp. 4_MG-2023 TaxID=3062623 RepID=UPI002733AB42|nr:lipopolysaccharide heptosyltransferase I [Oceanobacter sp. 4_MG-2023]MDP2548847.1 lipopolysaccharide heptosyltransferase I [Oceanobacter sp. 4_MG-2023]